MRAAINIKCAAAVCLLSLLQGCRSSSNLEIWKTINVQQLAAETMEQEKTVKTGLNIYVLRMDSAKLAPIQHLAAGSKEINFTSTDKAALAANAVAADGGGKELWKKLAALMADSSVEVKKTTALYSTQDIPDYIEAIKVNQPVSIAYYPKPQTPAGVGLEAGSVNFQIITRPLIGLRQECKLEILPVYKTTQKKKNFQKAGRPFEFSSAKIECRLKVGEFLILYPADAKNNSASRLGDIMFWQNGQMGKVVVYIIACNMMNEPI